MLNFDPDTRLADQIRVVENAVVVPWGKGRSRGMARPAGVFTADGEFCADAMTYRSATRPTTVEPKPPAAGDVKDEIKGTLLFGGLSYGHFGHALCESTARLWAIDAYDGHIDKILFMPKKKITWPMRSLSLLNPVFASMGALPPLIAINKPTRIERLVIAPQGFGVNDMMGGAPEFRAFTDRRWRQRVIADGPEKIYISRSEVFRKRGRLLFENEIEDHMRAEGFTIFHPQQHDLQSQLAHYKGAKMIVSTDNSALHLAAFVAGEDCKVAILVRRPGNIIADFQLQLRRFAGIEPVIADCCERYWFREGEPVQFNEIIALIDMEKTGEILAKSGFISNARWKNPTDAELDEELRNFEERGEVALTEVFT